MSNDPLLEKELEEPTLEELWEQKPLPLALESEVVGIIFRTLAEMSGLSTDAFIKKKCRQIYAALMYAARKDRNHWTCFHCGETFDTIATARDHFGIELEAWPGCVLNFTQPAGLPIVEFGEAGRGLLAHFREAQAQLEKYLNEDTDLHRQIHAMSAHHIQALKRAEERGYAKGLSDAVDRTDYREKEPT